MAKFAGTCEILHKSRKAALWMHPCLGTYIESPTRTGKSGKPGKIGDHFPLGEMSEF